MNYYYIIITGIPTYTLINTTDLLYPGRVHKLDLVNLQGEILVEAPVVYDPQRPWLYSVSQFLPPDGWFNLKVNQSFVFHFCRMYSETFL